MRRSTSRKYIYTLPRPPSPVKADSSAKALRYTILHRSTKPYT
jgi:hypothetical protein